MNSKRMLFQFILIVICLIFSKPVYATDFFLDLNKCTLNGITLEKIVDTYMDDMSDKERDRMYDEIIDLFTTSILKMNNYHSSKYSNATDLFWRWKHLKDEFGFSLGHADIVGPMSKKHMRSIRLGFYFESRKLNIKSIPAITKGTKKKYLEAVLGKPDKIKKENWGGTSSGDKVKDQNTVYIYNKCNIQLVFTFDGYDDILVMGIENKYLEP